MGERITLYAAGLMMLSATVILATYTIARPVVTPVVMGISLFLALALRLHAR